MMITPAINSLAFAGSWRRFIAYIVDASVLFFFFELLYEPIIYIFGSSNELYTWSLLLKFAIVSAFLSILYFSLFESSEHQGSIGKKIFGIKVVDIHGQRLTLSRAILRNILKFLCTVPLYLGLVGIFFTKKHQGLHDFFVSSVVVEDNSEDK